MLTKNDTLLVSGGAKGITAECVIRLAQAYQSKFILMGRSQLAASEPEWARGVADADLKKAAMQVYIAKGEKPNPRQIQKEEGRVLAQREITATLRRIKEAGGTAVYVSADAGDAGAVREAVDTAVAQTGPITGIIHGAGALADKFIQDKTSADFDFVYGVKIDGLHNMLAVVPPAQLKTLILFSSAAGFFGNPGQTDYALANDILNKTAHLVKQYQPNCKAVAVDWGPWDGGMVTPQLKKLFAERGVAIIPLDEGTELLVRELHPSLHGTAQIVVGGELAPADTPVGTTLKTHQISRVLRLEDNPFIHSHTIGEHGVIPATAVMAWMANAAEQLYPGFTFARAVEYRTLKGILFDETLAESYTLTLEETAKREEAITFKAMLSSTAVNQPLPRYHYSGIITIMRPVPPAPMHPFQFPAVAYAKTWDILADGTLFHGPLFAGVQKILRLDDTGLLLQCLSPTVTEQQQGQFPLQSFNLFAADVQWQGMAIWARYAYASAGLPAKVATAESYRPIPFDTTYYISLDVQSSSPKHVTANITIHDQAGTIYLRFLGAEVTLSQGLNELFAQGARIHYNVIT
jgi:NAD(P)-dependent dehydrogenase (short-subunit alcohol dehydrogenase family)